MHTDKNIDKLVGREAADAADDTQASELSWLLDMDLSEPEERLFAIEQSATVDTDLTDYELEVARRPMIRGATGADDLEAYIDEEIVISSETQSSDIYTDNASVSSTRGARDSQSAGDPMAIDYSRPAADSTVGSEAGVAEGIDILGLAEDDEMGEKFFVIKRVKSTTPAAPVAESTGGSSKAPAADTPVAGAPLVLGASSRPAPVEAPSLRLVSAKAPLELAVKAAAHPPAPTDKTIGQEQTGYLSDMGSQPAEAGVSGYLSDMGSQPAETEESGYLSDMGAQPAASDESGYLSAMGSQPAETDDVGYLSYMDSAVAAQSVDLVATISPLLPQLSDELAIVLNERLASLGMAPGSVVAQVRVAADPTAADQLVSEGFGPAIAVCPMPLASVQQLRQVEVDAIYLRLDETRSGQACNKLFDEDYEPVVQVLPEAVELAQEEVTAPEAPAGFAELSADTLFADDTLLAADAGQWQPQDDEIEDIFADFGALDSDEFAAGEHARQAQDTLADSALGDALDVFAEDLFAQELGSNDEGRDLAPQDDVDALFESLGLQSADGDDLPVMAVEETPVSGGHLQLVAQGDVPAEAEPAPAVCHEPALALIPAGITFSHASPGGGDIFADFLEAFVEEGSAELEKLEDAVAVWEKAVASEDAFAVVSRILHTIKGIAKGVGLQYYGTLVHNFETLLGALPRPQPGAEGDYFRIVNAWLDACVRGLDHIQDARADITHELPQVPGQPAAETAQVGSTDTVADIDAPVQAPVPRPAVAAVDARAKQVSKKVADEGARALAAQQSVRITSEKLDHLLNLSNEAQQLSVRTAQSVTRSKRASSEMQGRLASVRAHISAIADRALRSVAAKGVRPDTPMDALEMDQYSELQEAANILREGVEDLADLVDFATRQNAQVEALLKQQTKVISSIGTSIRGARVVPVSRLIPGLRRLVRTVSVDLDKTVSFQVLNELGTLDRDDYARCQTILDHMVRNALDHGIEGAEDRLAAGKPADGMVTIDIRKAGADAIITLADDGRGIDPDKLRQSAISKGLDVDVKSLSDAEALRLIFHKGFSTASSVSQISGRGVGMDIVLSEVQEMGGDIQIDSVPGRGTSFHIRVPSSVTVNGALLVSAGEQSYAIPLGGLIAVDQVPVEAFFSAVQHNSRLTLSGMECEPAYLATLCRSGHSLDAKTWQHNVPVIIAGSPERYMAIAIDDVEEAVELVIRSLGAQFSSVPGVAGAATTAAGEAIVALDLNLLVASVGVDDQSPLHVDAARDESLLVMVVDDSRTQRMVATSQLDTVGVETITAENGAVAIDLLNAADRLPDIILMDVEMPVKDGIQALREIRKSVRYGHVPVIMITSRTGLKHRAMAQAAGCNGYMGKPFNFRMLIGQINELTGHRLQLS